MPLDRIVGEDFQCHERVDVAPDPGVTTLVGESDSGKSAVLRLVRWVGLNRGGAGFARHGADGCKGTLVFDGVPLVRERRGRKNTYRLGDGPPFAALGRSGLPGEVSSLAGLDRSNFQGQLDPPYLLSLSPGDAARALNRVVDLGAIDAALKAAGTKVREADAALKAARGRRDAARLAAYKTRYAPLAVRRANALAGAEARHKAVRREIETLRPIAEKMALIAATKSLSAEAVAAGVAAVAAHARLVETAARRRAAARLAEDLKAARRKLQVAFPDRAWDDLLLARRAADDLAERRRAVEGLAGKLREARERRCRTSDALEAAVRELAAATPAVCPACGRPRSGTASPSTPPPKSPSRKPTGR